MSPLRIEHDPSPPAPGSVRVLAQVKRNGVTRTLRVCGAAGFHGVRYEVDYAGRGRGVTVRYPWSITGMWEAIAAFEGESEP